MVVCKKFVPLQSQNKRNLLSGAKPQCCIKDEEIMDLIKIAEQAFQNEKASSYPEFKAGDTITVTYRIKEGDKE